MSLIPIIKHLRSSTDMPSTTLSGASLGPTEALVGLAITRAESELNGSDCKRPFDKCIQHGGNGGREKNDN
jgi:hypothetical protein